MSLSNRICRVIALKTLKCNYGDIRIGTYYSRFVSNDSTKPPGPNWPKQKPTKRQRPSFGDGSFINFMDKKFGCLMSMDFKRRGDLVYPSPLNGLRELLVRKRYDPTFNISVFLDAAKQAIITVSECIGNNAFDELKDLVDAKALKEIEYNFHKLDEDRQAMIPVVPSDICYMFAGPIQIISQKSASTQDRKFLEIQTILVGVIYAGRFIQKRGSFGFLENAYVCTYRFSKEITKGVEDNWKIKRLNHIFLRDALERFRG